MFCFTDIQTYHGQLKTGVTTCAQAVQFYLDQIESQKNLNAYLEVFADEAIECAKVLDQERLDGKPMGSLHGVVVGIKDVISYKGHALSAASKMLENYTAVYSATAIEQLLAAGAIIIGRQNCDEFAMGSSNENSAFGAVKMQPINPWFLVVLLVVQQLLCKRIYAW